MNQARQIERSLWAMIAMISNSEDDRLEHLRLLWLKQMSILSNDDGIVLRTFNYRVTYVYLLKVSILSVVCWLACKPIR